MKKLLIALAITFISNLNADALSDAIRATDVEQVKTALAQGSFSKNNFIKYLDTAEEIIRLSREKLIFNSVKSQPCTDSQTKIYRNLGSACMGGAMISLCGMTMRDETFTPLCFRSSLLCIFGAACSIKLGHKRAAAYYDALHQDAILIKELLYDHLVTLE
jgi:hypothetical protein